MAPSLPTSLLAPTEPRLRPRWTLTRRGWRGTLATIVFLTLLLLLSSLPISQDAVSAVRSVPSPTSRAPSSPSVVSTAPAVLPSSGGAVASAANLCAAGVFQECPSPGPSAVASPDGDPVSSWANITPPAPRANPTERQLPAMSYDPSAHEVILFGGYGYAPGAPPATSAPVFLGDTWSFVDNRWTELINQSTCTATSCPSPRAGAMMTYYPPDDGLILFGGYKTIPCTGCILRPFIIIGYNDTWLFTNGTWTNLTASAGPAPPERYSGAMDFDPSDNYVLLFGGNDPSLNSLGDTWSFYEGTWTNLTPAEGGPTGYESLKAPEPRSFAAIANSPSGYVMLYGGADSYEEAADFDTVENYCNNGSYYAPGNSTVAWWFYHGAWKPMNGWGDICPPPPPKRPASSPASVTPAATVSGPPCGRYDAALGWSPKNARFVLYGGYGSTNIGVGANCGTNPGVLNDTWTYGNVSGGGFAWYNAGDSGDPSAREAMGYATDLTDDYFEIFGGLSATGELNSTWRFYEVVHAKISGPTGWNTGLSIHLTNPPFVVTGYGGSGDLSYTLRAVGLRTTNTLTSGTGCSPITDGKTNTLPFNGTVTFVCDPDARSFNLYRIVLQVTDKNNTTDTATSSWVYEVDPPELESVNSEYITYFYQGIDLSNVFTVYAQANGEAATSIVATLGDTPVTFQKTSGSPRWWNATVDMSSVPKGAVLHAEALWGNWSLNATYDVTMISFPSWLASVYGLAAGGSQKIVTSGAGPFNKTYTVEESYSWNLGSGMGFSIPVELLGGDYDAVPSMTVVFNASSWGDLGVTATLPITTPSIDLGPASLDLSIGFNLTGTFSVSGSSVAWDSAVANIDIAAGLSLSVPIYGFSILGINVGFTLQLQVNISAALKLILAPTTVPDDEIIPGIGVMIQNFLGTLTFALSAAINFGIAIASVGLGVGVSVALAFVTQPDFAIDQGWVNGSIFVEASFLFWSDSWNIASGTIYSWSDPPAEVPASGLPSYDNGTNTTWSLNDRYYNVSGVYDSDVWLPALTSGRAVDDIYPSTEVTGATAYNGAYLFFSNDNVDRPVEDGLEVAGERLSSADNALTSLPTPNDPGYLLFSPHAATLPDGDLYVVWSALPISEASDASPLDLTSIALQGAAFDPVNDSWGPVRTFGGGGLAESTLVDATGGAQDVLALVSSSPLVHTTTPERLVEYALSSGAVLSNVSVTGYSEIVSLRGGSSLALLETVGGNYTLVDTATGAPVAVGFLPAPGSDLLSASYVAGSPSLLALLYVGGNTSELVLYDTSTDTTVATLSLGTNVSEVDGITTGGSVYVFVRDGQGVEGFVQSGATFEPLAHAAIPHLESFGLVQDGASILVYGLGTNGTKTQPTVSLWFLEVGADLAPAPLPAAARPSISTPASALAYLVYLAGAAGVVAVVLGTMAIRRRRPRTPAPTPPEGAGLSPASPAPEGPPAAGTPPRGG